MDAGSRTKSAGALERLGWWPIVLVLVLDVGLMPWVAHPYDAAAFLSHADRVFFAHVRPATLWPYGGLALLTVLASQLPVLAFPQLWPAAPLRIALLKMPMLLADAGTALVIRQTAGPGGGNFWALRYLLDPAVFFATVVHGQTDALAGFFAVGGIALTMSGRFELAAVLLGAGTGAKLYPAAFVPLLLVAAYRNGSARRAAVCAAYFAAAAGLSLFPVVAGRAAAFAGSFANNSFGAESRRVESASPWGLLNAFATFARPAYEQLTAVLVPLVLAIAELRHRPQRVDIARAAMMTALAVVMLNPGAHPPFYLWIAGPLVLYCAVTGDGLVSAVGALLSATAVAMQFCQEGSEEYLLLNFGAGYVPGALRCVAPDSVLLAFAALAAAGLVFAAYRRPLSAAARATASVVGLAVAGGITLYLGVAFSVAATIAAAVNPAKAQGFADEMNLVNTFAIDPEVRGARGDCQLTYDASDLIVYADNAFAAPYGSAALGYTLFSPETVAIRGRPVSMERLPQRFENVETRTVAQRDVRLTREFDVSTLLRPFRYVEHFVESPCGLIPGTPLLIYRFDVAAAARDASQRPFWERFNLYANQAEGRRAEPPVP